MRVYFWPSSSPRVHYRSAITAPPFSIRADRAGSALPLPTLKNFDDSAAAIDRGRHWDGAGDVFSCFWGGDGMGGEVGDGEDTSDAG